MFTKINELIWTDEKFKSLSDDSKFLFIYVLTCPHRNILGFYFLPIPYGSFDLGWDNKRFEKGLQELITIGLVNYNSKTNIIFIKNFLKYNPLENPNQVKGAIKALASIPADGIDVELINYLNTVNKPFIKPLVELLEKRLEKGLVKQVDVEVDVDVDVDEEVNIYRKVQHLILTVSDFNKLNEIYNQTDIDDVLDQMENWKKLNTKKSAYLTAKNWLKRNGAKVKSNTTVEEEKPWMLDFIPEDGD